MHVAAWERQFINLQLDFIFTWDLNIESIQIAQLKGSSKPLEAYLLLSFSLVSAGHFREVKYFSTSSPRKSTSIGLDYMLTGGFSWQAAGSPKIIGAFF